MAIVDLLEVIHVEHEQRQGRRMPLCVRDFGIKPVEEVALVARLGRPVVERRVVHPLLKALFKFVGVRELKDGRRSHLDLVAIAQDGATHRVPIDEGPVGALEIHDPHVAAATSDLRVVARYPIVLQANGRIRRPTDDHVRLIDAEHLAESVSCQNDEVGAIAGAARRAHRRADLRLVLVALVVPCCVHRRPPTAE